MTTHRKRAVIVGVLSIIATAFLFIGEAVYKPILSSAQPQEAAELETFIDGLMTAQLEEYQIPGSVVVIVQDGEVSLAKGYGYANMERKLKVDPETSMFRIASISKLFIYTAVMQLVEEGKLDLDTPIVDYLSSAGMSAKGIDESITVKHLMMSLVLAAFIVAQIVSMINGTSFGTPAYLTVVTAVLPVAVILAFATVVFAVLAWTRRAWGVGARLHYSLVALVGLSLVGQLTYFNLLTVPW